jgi:antitoxin component YwqK of YwqJK toxin-antitoxin module
MFHQEIIFDLMKPLLPLTVMSLAVGNISAIAQTKDTIYFNVSWRDTTAANASYYRVRTRQGEFAWFDSTGIAFHKCSYTKNKKEGKETYTWPNKKMMTGINRDDQMEGEWLGYYRNGQVAGDVVYAKGKQVSGTFYNEDGSHNPS